MASDTDRIEKTTFLNAPLERVWGAIGDAKQFGRWFGVEFDGPFVPGARVSGRIVPTTVDDDVAKLQEPHRGTAFEIFLERVEPMQVLAFRWHPAAPDAGDLDAEPTTLVEFALAAEQSGTRLTLTESGFDALPRDRRAKAFEGNSEGWGHQLKLIEKYLAQQS